MIRLIKGYKYDNRYDYIKTFSSAKEQADYFESLDDIRIYDEDCYVKEHNSFKVEFEYDYLVNEGVNYIIFNNGFRDVYAFITSKEYLSEDVTRLNFEIDIIQTYMFNFDIKKSFVERKVCTLNEITDYDEGLEIGEHKVVSNTVVYEKDSIYFAMFTGFKQYLISDDNKSVSELPMANTNVRPITNIDGINYPLLFMPLNSSNMDTFKNHLLDNPSLVGIVRFPKCNFTIEQIFIPLIKKVNGTIIESGVGVQMASNITSVSVSGGSVEVPLNTITDFYPYTYYVLTDGESTPLTIMPQYTNGTIQVKGKFALSHTPVERFYPTYYKGDSSGIIYNITNAENMTLPVGQNTGLEYLTSNSSSIQAQKEVARTNQLLGYSMSAAGMLGSALTGNVIGMGLSALSGIQTAKSSYNSIKESMARLKDIETTPSSIKSFGTPSTRNAFNTNKVRIIKYTIEDKYKNRINNFIERYGNKYNNYANINLRSYKGFIKFNSPDIDSKLDNEIIASLITILERGVYVE